MTSKIKKLGIALVAVAALGMVAASAVQASSVDFTSGGSTSIFGRQTVQVHKWQFTKPGISAQCTQALFEGTHTGSGSSPSNTQDITLTPTYTSCTCWGLACQIKMNGCKYTFTGEAQPALTFKVDIVGCTSGKKIELITIVGTVTIGEQNTIADHVILANEGSHPLQSLNATFTLQGITYQCDGMVPNCPNGTQTVDGDYTGQATFEGRVCAGGVQAQHNGHTYQKLNQTGALVGLQAT